MASTEYRQRVAALARRLRAGEIDLFTFLQAVGPPNNPYKTGDEQVDELIDLFEHQPGLDGILGAGPEFYTAHMVQIDRLIRALESENP